MKTTPTRFVSLFLPVCTRAAFTGRLLSAVLLGPWLLLGFVALHSRVTAQVPERFSYQGYLEDGNGQALAPTTPVNYDVVFRIYPNASSPTPVLWAERQTVTIDKGNYSVVLGQGVQVASEPHGDLSAVVTTATGSELYVQTTVNINGSDTTLLPRLRLLPSAYSFLAKKALSVDGSGITSGTIAADRLQSAVYSTITNGPVADSRLSLGLRTYITNGPVADSRLSATIVSGPIADNRLSANVALRTNPSQIFDNNLTVIGSLGVGGGSAANPNGRLFVAGGVRARGGSPGSNGVNDNGYAFMGGNGDTDSGMFSSADGQVEFYSNGSERMRLSANGRVGIGTATPAAPLEVRGSASVGYGGNTIHFGINAGTGGSDVTVNSARSWNVSILAQNFVNAQGFVAFSDARIKRDKQVSEAAKDLETLLQLKVTDYRMVDSVANGSQLNKGFIAQEVQAVIPEAVSVGRNFVPDIYAVASSVTPHRDASAMTVKMSKGHGLRAGDKVRLMTDDETFERIVTQVGSDTEFQVEQIKGDPKRVFVYGREVSDFMAVDYDRIFTTGIGAIQELARKAQLLEVKVRELESKQAQLAELETKASRADALEKANAELQSRIEHQDKRLAALESLMREKLNGVQQAGVQSENLRGGN